MCGEMKKHLWVQNFPCAITVCDKKGYILEMNAKSIATFFKNGGKKLIGKDVLKCHPTKARAKLKKMLKLGKSNAYTIEKNSLKKLIYQSPWYGADGRYAGFVELSLPIPNKMAHFVRKG
jgi:DUF438 domain-containing protein